MIVYVVTREETGWPEYREVFAVMTTAAGAADAAAVALAGAPDARVAVLEYAADQLPVSFRRVRTLENP